MLRLLAFCLAAIGVVAAVVVVHRGDTPDVGATQSSPETEIAPADGGESPAAPSTGVLAEHLTDAEVRALLERLVTLDGVGALQDDALVRLVEQHLATALEHVVARADVAARGKLLARLADFAAGIDPLHALDAADSLADDRFRAGDFCSKRSSVSPQRTATVPVGWPSG